jgi:phosphatidylserine decarboxylase
MVRRFIRQYQVNMNEAAQPNPAAYATFNDFFTRALKPGARPLAHAPWVCPVDGAVSQLGPIHQGQIFQAKGHAYAAQELLACSASEAQQWANGTFATIYLSPRDYHRIHMPCAGRLLRMTLVPGLLHSVNPATAARVPALFARNERLITWWQTAHGPMVLVLVGATIVGSMATTWHGVVNAQRDGQVHTWDYSDQSIELAQGDEMGRFMLGSTVVLLWPAQTLQLAPAMQPKATVRMGQVLGLLSHDAPATPHTPQ